MVLYCFVLLAAIPAHFLDTGVISGDTWVL